MPLPDRLTDFIEALPDLADNVFCGFLDTRQFRHEGFTMEDEVDKIQAVQGELMTHVRLQFYLAMIYS